MQVAIKDNLDKEPLLIQYVAQTRGMGEGKDYVQQRICRRQGTTTRRVARGKEFLRIGTSPITTILLNR